MKIPLEMKGMVRYSRPTTPLVGLCRQSKDPERSKYYSQEAKKRRDLVCFPSMLRTSTRRCMVYRAIRRLYIRTLDKFLRIHCYKHYLIGSILDMLPFKSKRIPLMFSYHHWYTNYTTLSPRIRMQQLGGKLVSLGYRPMTIPDVDYELEGYLELSKNPNFVHSIDTIPDLYHELKRKNITNKWVVLHSHIKYRNFHVSYTKEEWLKYCKENQLTLLLNACIRENKMTCTEVDLLEGWINVIKYPSH